MRLPLPQSPTTASCASLPGPPLPSRSVSNLNPLASLLVGGRTKCIPQPFLRSRLCVAARHPSRLRRLRGEHSCVARGRKALSKLQRWPSEPSPVGDRGHCAPRRRRYRAGSAGRVQTAMGCRAGCDCRNASTLSAVGVWTTKPVPSCSFHQLTFFPQPAVFWH